MVYKVTKSQRSLKTNTGKGTNLITQRSSFPQLLPLSAPDHSRSEMDLSGPGSEHSNDALSLRSRSVPGINETVSAISAPLLLNHMVVSVKRKSSVCT